MMLGAGRVDVKAIIQDEDQLRELMVGSIVAIQAREGITTTREEAARAWDLTSRRRQGDAS